MTEDSDAYHYTPFLDMAVYYERPQYIWAGPLVAQPIAGLMIVVLYCYESIYDPRGRASAGYGAIWFWLTLIAFVVPTVWTVYGYIEHRIDEAKRARAWPAVLAAKRAAAAEKLRLEREAADQARREQLAAHRAKLEAEARAARCTRLAQLEGLALNLRAHVGAKVDFFGDGDPTAAIRSVRQALLGLGCADLGLLRESTNTTVREIVGDGAFLPPTPLLGPPLSAPLTTPVKAPPVVSNTDGI